MRILNAIVAGLTLLATSPASLAIVSKAAPGTVPARTVTDIERGGIVEVVDMRNRRITVDGRTYELPFGPLPVHGPAGTPTNKPVELKRGTKIRFSTSRENFSSQERVREVWVVE